MYKNYLRELKQNKYEGIVSAVSKPDLQLVKSCWDNLDKQLGHYNPECACNSSINSNSHWKIARIFVSSTFTDFHNEREMLIKKVFPKLREYCEAKHVHLIECDLRWGVPKDSTSSTTILTCMEELDHCHAETLGEPFFVSMLGERYGWIPSAQEIPKEAFSEYDWIEGVSITHMEIHFGAYRNHNRNAIFCLRNPEFIDDLNLEDVPKFRDNDSLKIEHLQKLKEKLKTRFANQYLNYSCRYSGKDDATGRQLVKLEGLDEFGENVYNFLKTAIETKFCTAKDIPEMIQVNDALDKDAHDAIMETKFTLMFGREKDVKLLKEYVNGVRSLSFNHSCVSETSTEELDKFKLKASDEPLLAVTGESGIGKSALLAKTAQELLHEGHSVLYHCVGVTSSSFDHRVIVARILLAVEESLTEPSEVPVIQVNINNYEENLSKIASAFAKRKTSDDKSLVIIIDGLDELSNSGSANRLSWLFPKTPKGIFCIVSFNSKHQLTANAMGSKGCFIHYLYGFDLQDRKYLVQHYFNTYRKKLDKENIGMLVSHPGASSPLWLSAACEELRIFGDFRMLSYKISTLLADLQGLFAAIIDRLIREDDSKKMKMVLQIIACSNGGILESQIPGLLGNIKTREPVSFFVWAQLRRSIKALLHSVMKIHYQEPILNFRHKAILQAVEKAVLPEYTDIINCHQHMASYYLQFCKDEQYAAVEIPYHLMKAEDRQGLVSFLRRDWRAMKLPHYIRVEYSQQLRCKKMVANLENMRNEHTMCSQCGMKSNLSPSSFPNKDKCIICGEWSPNTIFKHIVPKLCMQHTRMLPAGMDYCTMCKKMLHSRTGVTLKAHFCSICALWQQSKMQCTYIDVE